MRMIPMQMAKCLTETRLTLGRICSASIAFADKPVHTSSNPLFVVT